MHGPEPALAVSTAAAREQDVVLIDRLVIRDSDSSDVRWFSIERKEKPPLNAANWPN